MFAAKWRGQDVSVKVCSMLDEEQKQLFKHETRLWKYLDFPTVGTLYGACIERDCLCLVVNKKKKKHLVMKNNIYIYIVSPNVHS